MEPTLKIGFVGTGIMGAPMAANLLRAGFPVSVYNRTAAKCEPLQKEGAEVAESPAAAARGSDIVITIVSDTPDVEAVLFGANGIAEEIRSGGIVIDMSTISARATARFAERLAAQGVSLLDAPVSGGEAGAINATLSIMAGGDRAAFDKCLPVFRSMGRNVVYTGPSGSGQRTKMVNQVVGSLNLLAVVEGLRVTKAAGLDPATTLQAVGSGAAGSWMITNIGPKIAAGDFRPGFMVRLQQKDLRLAGEMLQELGLDAPGTALMLQLFTKAVEKGLGDAGNHGIYKLWE